MPPGVAGRMAWFYCRHARRFGCAGLTAESFAVFYFNIRFLLFVFKWRDDNRACFSDRRNRALKLTGDFSVLLSYVQQIER